VTGQDYTAELPVFEGPLDLLLHLVKKHELDIFEIPISFITDRYLEYLDFMRKLNLEVAGEYLLMAAQLAHIKSRELLPTPDPTQVEEEGADGEEIDTRQELIRRLLEYQKYKAAAGQLGDRPVVGRNVWLRGAPVEDALGGEVASEAEAPLAEVPLYSLVEALADVLSRARVRIAHDVTVERFSITDRINQLVDRLEAEGTFSFRSCFALEGQSAVEVRHQIVVTFLAILEMARLRLLRILQPPEGAGPGDITLTREVAS
jgi:segregation and condensation protein A